MQFALNYSPAAAELVEARRIQFDLYKCPDWPEMIEKATQQYPAYVHFPLIAGQNNIEQVGLDHIERLLETTPTPFVNTHIGPRTADMDDPEDADEIVRRAVADILPLVAHFGPERVIAENVPYPDIYNDKPRLASMPHIIERIIYTANCGLLLDLAHARLAAEYLDMDTRDYIAQLPVERLRELHVTGVGISPQGERTDHMPMSSEDWSLLEWALASIRRGMWGRPQIIACEYGGVGDLFDWRTHPAILVSDIPRMYELIRQFQYV